MLEVQPLPLCFPAVAVPTLWLDEVQQVGIGPPGTIDEVVLSILLVHNMLVCSRVPHPQVVVQDDTRSHYEGCSIHMDLEGGEETAETVGKDAKGVLHHTTGSGQPVVEDLLAVVQTASREGFHQPGPHGERVIPYDSFIHSFIHSLKLYSSHIGQLNYIQRAHIIYIQ